MCDPKITFMQYNYFPKKNPIKKPLITSRCQPILPQPGTMKLPNLITRSIIKYLGT